MEKHFEKEPGEALALPKKPWRAGEARPFGALPLTVSAAGSTVLLGLITLAMLAAPKGGALRDVASMLSTCWVFSDALSTPFAMLSGRKMSLGAIGLAARFGGLKGAAKVTLVGSVVGVAGWALGSILPKRKHELPEGAPAGAWAGACEAHERYALPARLLSQFGSLCHEKGGRLNRAADLLISQSPEQLNDIGAWRVARGLTRDGKYAEAAEVWLASAFNPSWPVRLKEDGEGKLGKFFGKSATFEQAMEQGALLSSDAEQRRFCEKTAGVMRSVRERWAIEDGLESGASPAPEAAAIPEGKAKAKARL